MHKTECSTSSHCKSSNNSLGFILRKYSSLSLMLQNLHEWHEAEKRKQEQKMLAQGINNPDESNDSEEDASESEWIETPSRDSQAVADLVSTMKRTSSEDVLMKDSAKQM